ncbi:hypothetical protein RB195_023443 [Necator americanus]|uniref:Uncharacterized protein n=1 Tax=Necator americanus TaxID=51031 RepID=A0ABR1EJF4_NECAM
MHSAMTSLISDFFLRDLSHIFNVLFCKFVSVCEGQLGQVGGIDAIVCKDCGKEKAQRAYDSRDSRN